MAEALFESERLFENHCCDILILYFYPLIASSDPIKSPILALLQQLREAYFERSSIYLCPLEC